MRKILCVHLNRNKVEINEINENETLNYDINDLVFEAPILAGYGLIGINRLSVYSKEAFSKCGGYFAHYMKCLGYDYLVLKGQAYKPIYIYIDKEIIKIIDASHIYEENPKNTEARIKEELNCNKLEIAEIGLAGINKIDFSKIMFRGEKSCGKNGLGKLMGEKNIKAIVIKQYGTLEIDKKEKLDILNEKMRINLGEEIIDSFYNKNNNCYGCTLNCKSTIIKKISKLGFLEDESKKIEKICNEYGMDTIIFANRLREYRNKEKISTSEFANKVIENKNIFTDISLGDKSIKNKKEDELCEVGFCKFLVDRNILDISNKSELFDIIN